MRGLLAVLVVALAQAASSAQSGAAGHVDRAQLMRDVETLGSPAFEGRAAGSDGGLRARAWIVDRFRASGLLPAGSSGYLQPFTVPGSARDTANVLGRIAGRELRARTIVVTAHYDHLGIQEGVIHPGADDNASGIAALLAVARHFVAHVPRHTLLLAALDAEEIGQRGARALVASPLIDRARVAINVNLDMLSKSPRREVFAAGPYHSPWLVPILDEARARAAVTLRYGHDRPPPRGGGLDDWTRLSDHVAFHDAGLPFVYFGVEDHPDYHKPTDTADRIDPGFYGDVVDLIIEALRTIDARVE